ncbi:hypothetical protein GH714_031898 [Hevea brasiliensis]|uniref:H15 domain-containing protein n=1 Tax=Hevea brasiliensis TaxID=3981 RepID=A0A6A6M2B0_HEVBR|nr:hypothetical protein GH714_031898 [Hevea brasiliensis]
MPGDFSTVNTATASISSAAGLSVEAPNSNNHIAHAANATPTVTQSFNHPPYADMIFAAITALKEREGSSKRAIAKYIEKAHTGLPPTHSALLTHHLKRLKSSGLLVMPIEQPSNLANAPPPMTVPLDLSLSTQPNVAPPPSIQPSVAAYPTNAAAAAASAPVAQLQADAVKSSPGRPKNVAGQGAPLVSKRGRPPKIASMELRKSGETQEA